MERNIFKMIDLTQFMLMESTGDSEAKSDHDMGSSFSSHHQRFFPLSDDDGDGDRDGDGDGDDAESCSYGSSSRGYADGVRDKKNVHRHNDNDDDDDRMSYVANHDDDTEEEDDDDDAIDSKKCGAFVMGRRQEKRDCSKSNTKFLNEKENDKNFWETCLAS